jgi:hypothetical protein
MKRENATTIFYKITNTGSRSKILERLLRRKFGTTYNLFWNSYFKELTCGGDAKACLKRALDRVPRKIQLQARQDILAATPRNIGAPERAARQCMPYDFYV